MLVQLVDRGLFSGVNLSSCIILYCIITRTIQLLPCCRAKPRLSACVHLEQVHRVHMKVARTKRRPRRGRYTLPVAAPTTVVSQGQYGSPSFDEVPPVRFVDAVCTVVSEAPRRSGSQSTYRSFPQHPIITMWFLLFTEGEREDYALAKQTTTPLDSGTLDRRCSDLLSLDEAISLKHTLISARDAGWCRADENIPRTLHLTFVPRR